MLAHTRRVIEVFRCGARSFPSPESIAAGGYWVLGGRKWRNDDDETKNALLTVSEREFDFLGGVSQIR